MRQQPDNRNRQHTLSPTPLRDWINRQSRRRRAALVALFILLIACGGKAAVHVPFTPVPISHQILFVMLAGALLGSRLGALSAAFYLLSAAVTGLLWPEGAGATPLTGPLAGYLWSLPLVAYLSGYFVERARSEQSVFFAIGVSAGIAAFDASGSARLLFALGGSAAEAFVKGVGFFVGPHVAHGALTVMVASSASATLQAREKK